MPWRHRIRIVISIPEREGILSTEAFSQWILVLSTVFMCGLIYAQDKLQPANACSSPEFAGASEAVRSSRLDLLCNNLSSCCEHDNECRSPDYVHWIHLSSSVQPRAKPSSELTYLAHFPALQSITNAASLLPSSNTPYI